jgi:DNA-binding HxlR family transcriptional regulator
VHPESCPVLRTADIISGKWTLLILRDLSKGINRFSALERSLAGISPKTLSERLKGLEKAGIVTRKSYAEVPPRVEYTLTGMGWDLIPEPSGSVTAAHRQAYHQMMTYPVRSLPPECVGVGGSS